MKVALYIEGKPDDDGRVSLTALWLRDGKLRGQCFFTDPAKTFKGDETKRFNPADGDAPAIAWLEEA